MKLTETFSAYLPIADAQRTALWEHAVVVFDANVLLQFYRYGPNTRKEVIDLLKDRLRDRIWLPYQVALEFFRNRSKLIDEDARRVSDLETKLGQWVANLSAMVDDSRLHELGALSNPSELARRANEAVEPLKAELKRIKAEYPDLRQNDSVVDFVAALVKDAIGRSPDQGQVTVWDQLAEDRYKRKVPPGYEDAKSKGGDFVDRNVTYLSANGDVYLWLQLIQAVVEEPQRFNAIIFVTNDQKKDWWEISGGKTAGPRVELRQEICEAGTQLFHMYTLSQFLEHLKTTDGGKQRISAASIDEVKNTEQVGIPSIFLSDGDTSTFNERHKLLPVDSFGAFDGGEISERAVCGWLLTRYPDANIEWGRKKFPDITLQPPDAGVELGFEVIFAANLGAIYQRCRLAVDRGLAWQRARGIDSLFDHRLTIVLALPPGSTHTRPDRSTLGLQIVRCVALTTQAQIGLVVGTVEGNAAFHQIPLDALMDWDRLNKVE